MYVTEKKCLETREILADQINLGFSEVSTLLKHLINIQNAQNERLNITNEKLNTTNDRLTDLEEQSERRHKELIEAIKGLRT